MVNNKQPIKSAHGSDKIMEGKLKGTTDTDYFYFLCPDCKEIMELKNYHIHKYKDDSKAIRITLELYCRKCKYYDYTKISNVGWVGGKL